MFSCSTFAVREEKEEECSPEELLHPVTPCIRTPSVTDDLQCSNSSLLVEFQSLRVELLACLDALSASHKSELEDTRREILHAFCQYLPGNQNGIRTDLSDVLHSDDILIGSVGDDMPSTSKGEDIDQDTSSGMTTPLPPMAMRRPQRLSSRGVFGTAVEPQVIGGRTRRVSTSSANSDTPTSEPQVVGGRTRRVSSNSAVSVTYSGESAAGIERQKFSIRTDKTGNASSNLGAIMMSTMSSQKVNSKRKSVNSLMPYNTMSVQSFEKKRCLGIIVGNVFFDWLCALIIMSFLVYLGFETDYCATHEGESLAEFFLITVAFNTWFAFELLLRMIVEKKGFFSAQHRNLNVMDMVFVFASIVDMLMELLSGKEAWMKKSMVIGRALRGIRLLRVMRIMRLARVLRHVQQFQKMLTLVQASTTTLLWCLVLLLCLLYMFAILFTQGASDHLELIRDEDRKMTENDIHLKAHFGSVPRALSRLFQSMSGGVDWGNVMEPLQRLNPLYIVLFLVFITFSIFGVLNVMTSVFVETTMKSALAYRDFIVMDAQKNKETAVHHLKKVFEEMDVDNDGVLTKDEVSCFLQDAQVQSYIEALQIDLSDTFTLFNLLDTSKSGYIRIDDFCEGCLKLRGDAKAFDVHCMIYDIAQFMEKWSDFTEYTVTQFQKMERFCRDVRSCTSTMDARTSNMSNCLPNVFAQTSIASNGQAGGAPRVTEPSERRNVDPNDLRAYTVTGLLHV